MKDIKMSKWFPKDLSLFGDTIEDDQFAYAVMCCEYEVNGIDAGHAICHAINNHDRLVEENTQLKADKAELLASLNFMNGQFGEPDGSDFLNEADYQAVAFARRLIQKHKEHPNDQ